MANVEHFSNIVVPVLWFEIVSFSEQCTRVGCILGRERESYERLPVKISRLLLNGFGF